MLKHKGRFRNHPFQQKKCPAKAESFLKTFSADGNVHDLTGKGIIQTCASTAETQDYVISSLFMEASGFTGNLPSFGRAQQKTGIIKTVIIPSIIVASRIFNPISKGDKIHETT